jgi:gamma-glutamyltranspeptidase
MPAFESWVLWNYTVTRKVVSAHIAFRALAEKTSAYAGNLGGGGFMVYKKWKKER